MLAPQTICTGSPPPEADTFAAGDTIALKRIAPDMFEETLKTGKVVRTVRQVISKDGRVLTATLTGTNAGGQRVHVVLVYDKQ